MLLAYNASISRAVKKILLGRVGQDPEIKTLENGRKMARFSLATNEYYLFALGEKVEKTQWHTVVFWNRNVESIESFVCKGTQISLSGSLNTHSWEDESTN